jgi:hypothetical protein
MGVKTYALSFRCSEYYRKALELLQQDFAKHGRKMSVNDVLIAGVESLMEARGISVEDVEIAVVGGTK